MILVYVADRASATCLWYSFVSTVQGDRYSRQEEKLSENRNLRHLTKTSGASGGKSSQNARNGGLVPDLLLHEGWMPQTRYDKYVGINGTVAPVIPVFLPVFCPVWEI